MNTSKFYCGSYLFKVLFAFLFLSLISFQSYAAANYPLEILQPQPNLDTKNRFYKAYPGLEYNVRVAVIGGVYPFNYELTNAPQGMSIDSKGVITWSNPAASEAPYTVSVKVTDAQTSAKSVSWTVTVTTKGFRFIDGVNGTPSTSGGTGSIDKPWKSLKDMYEGDSSTAKNASSYAGEFAYWRNGNYTMDAYKEDSGQRVPFVGNKKPQVWLAYPGEKPVIDMGAAHIVIYAGGSNTYFDGLELNVNRNSRGMGVQIDSDASNVTFRNNNFYGLRDSSSQGGNNSLLFIAKGSNVGKNWAIQNNDMHEVYTGYGVLGYRASHVLIEDNNFFDISGHPIGPKQGTAMWFIRANRVYANDQNSINLQYSNSSGIASGDIEISYNSVEAGGGMVRMNSNYTSSGKPVYIFRNTFMDDVEINKVTASNGVFKFSDNVIVNGSSSADKIQRNSIDHPSNLVVINNLVGSPSDNIVDFQGFLTANYKQYVGIRGHQVGVDRRPLPPVVMQPVVVK